MSLSLDQQPEITKFVFAVSARQGLPKYIKAKALSTYSYIIYSFLKIK